MLRSAVVGSLALVTLLGGVAQRPEVPETNETRIPPPPPEPPPPSTVPLDLSAIVKGIPQDAPRQQIDAAAARLVAAFTEMTSGQAAEATAALASVRDQPLIVTSLIGYFDGLRAEEGTGRLTTLAIIGELRRIEAAPFFQKVIWTPLPTSGSRGELSTVSGLEEMLRVKAVHGLAYLRTTDADDALIDIMRRHNSVAVKIAAIDSYMWNHDDSAGAAQTLYGELPPDFHRFVQRPRFHAGVDRKQFNEQLRAWQEKWASRQAKP
jgi:hypothetical protein